jgi:hypothetical protein
MPPRKYCYTLDAAASKRQFSPALLDTLPYMVGFRSWQVRVQAVLALWGHAGLLHLQCRTANNMHTVAHVTAVHNSKQQ